MARSGRWAGAVSASRLLRPARVATTTTWSSGPSRRPGGTFQMAFSACGDLTAKSRTACGRCAAVIVAPSRAEPRRPEFPRGAGVAV